jgi:hypothetical protein
MTPVKYINGTNRTPFYIDADLKEGEHDLIARYKIDLPKRPLSDLCHRFIPKGSRTDVWNGEYEKDEDGEYILDGDGNKKKIKISVLLGRAERRRRMRMA